jgi:hypothetical protein
MKNQILIFIFIGLLYNCTPQENAFQRNELVTEPQNLTAPDTTSTVKEEKIIKNNDVNNSSNNQNMSIDKDPFSTLGKPFKNNNTENKTYKRVNEPQTTTCRYGDEAEEILEIAERIGCDEAVDAAQNAIDYCASGNFRSAASELSNAESYLDDCRSNRGGGDDDDDDSEDD